MRYSRYSDAKVRTITGNSEKLRNKAENRLKP